MATGGQPRDSPAYSTLRKSYRKLVALVKQQPGEICDALFEKSYINSSVRDYTRLSTVTDESKVQKLIDALVDNVKMDHSVYHGFMDILKSMEPWADTIVEELEELFKAEQTTYEESHHSASCMSN